MEQYKKILEKGFYLCYTKKVINAGVAELADALDLGSSGKTVQVQVLSPVPTRGRANQQNSISAYGHNFVEISHSDFTCTNAGTHTLSCSNCGLTYSEQTFSPLGHVFGGENIADNEHSHTCSCCGMTESEAHNWQDLWIGWHLVRKSCCICLALHQVTSST